MTKICTMLKHYIMVRASASRIITDKKDKDVVVAESREGLLGLLSRFYDAAGACRGKTNISSKREAITRARNAINKLDDIIMEVEDRLFLGHLITPIIKQIPHTPSEKISSKADMKEADDYINIRKQIEDRLSRICSIDNSKFV